MLKPDLNLKPEVDLKRRSFVGSVKPSLLLEPELTEAEENKIANEMYGNQAFYDPSIVADR